jgi:hypothetical protein
MKAPAKVAVLGAVVILMLGLPVVANSQVSSRITAQPQHLACCAPTQLTHRSAIPPSMGAAPDPTSYDEQIGMTFTQSFTSLAYNVTAVKQSDPTSGTGPAYLLNGLSDQGYWYQVGLSWNWNPGNTPGTGFGLNYEVFGPNGDSIFPTNGYGGLESFSGPVNVGDTVLLNLYFSSIYGVVMFAEDYNTGAVASQSYSAEGGSEFIGLSSNTANQNGFFTGLMTEWYHSSPFYGNISPVKYSDPSFGLTSAWMWMDEFSCSDTSCSSSTIIFSDATSGPVYYSSPSLLQEFSSNGATEYSDAYSLITGPAYYEMTVSFSVDGGGTGYGQPNFYYSYNGAAQTATLTQSPVTYSVDIGSSWSASAELTGSSQSERWALSVSATSGVVTSPQTINFSYQHQYLLSVTGGSGGTNGDGWYASGSTAAASSFGVFDRSGGSGQRVSSYALDGQSTQVSPTTSEVSVTVPMDGPHQVTFSSIPQFQVSLNKIASDALNSITPPTITGDYYWYDEGTPITVMLNGVWGRHSGTGSRLVSYTANGGPVVTTDEVGPVTVDSVSSIASPQSVAATAILQYALSTPDGVVASTTPPSISGDAGWYDTGSNITIEYEYTWNETAGQVRVVATGYSLNGGRVMGISEHDNNTFAVNLTMSSFQIVGIKSATQYYTHFVVTNASGTGAIIPTELQIMTSNQTLGVTGLATWLNASSTFTISTLIYGGVNVTPSSQTQYAVNGPANVTLRALVYNAAVKVSDFLGVPVAGAQVKMTLANGTIITGQTGGDGLFTAANIPLGNFTARVSSLGSDTQVIGDVSSEAITPVRVFLSTTVFALIAVLVVVAAISVVVLRRRRKGRSQSSGSALTSDLGQNPGTISGKA